MMFTNMTEKTAETTEMDCSGRNFLRKIGDKKNNPHGRKTREIVNKTNSVRTFLLEDSFSTLEIPNGAGPTQESIDLAFSFDIPSNIFNKQKY
ncbi:hypothetical protein [Cryptosporidium hominis TU502]|uniref:hypothetical protein n=1 Tax=Cryptosporidium hominis (strain TU502) TaxID=353151 RepID=UPI000045287A|nr:hypothetical protein [Cryptosporidium hominis TU502]